MAEAVQKEIAAEQHTGASSLGLSAIHSMLPKVRRDRTAHEINRVVNHPDVYRWVRGYQLGRLDLTSVAANPANVLLMGEHGGLLFCQIMPGIFEVHSSILPEGRGQWAALMARTCLHIMFTQSEAVEIVTRVPSGNLGARTLTLMCGFDKDFRRPASLGGWVMDGDPVPADVFSLTIQKWQRTAPGLVERGRWFHEKLEKEYRRFGKTEKPHEDDEVHDRYVGMAIEMLLAGNIVKAMTFYNRWALIAGYQSVSALSANPLTIDINDAILCFKDADFWVMSCR